MGATNISMYLPGTLTKEQVKAAFQKRKDEDRVEYGTDSYNGSFSTIDSVRIEDRVFDTVREAEDYCLNNAEKWSYAVAVKTRSKTTTRKRMLFTKAEKDVHWRSLLIGEVWVSVEGSYKLGVADEVPARDQKRLLTLWHKRMALAKAYEVAERDVSDLMRQAAQSTFDVTTAWVSSLRKAVKARRQAAVKRDAVVLTFTAMEKQLANEHYPEQVVDGEMQWIIAGWAAE